MGGGHPHRGDGRTGGQASVAQGQVVGRAQEATGVGAQRSATAYHCFCLRASLHSTVAILQGCTRLLSPSEPPSHGADSMAGESPRPGARRGPAVGSGPPRLGDPLVLGEALARTRSVISCGPGMVQPEG